MSFLSFRPENIVEGDVLVLTKPLGTQVAVNVHQWLSTGNYWDAVKDSISEDEGKL